MNKKGFFAEPTSLAAGVLLLAKVSVMFSGLVIGTGLTQENGAEKLKQDGRLIWCQMQNKGKDYCQSQYPRL